jgi:micrococcal nuclease
MKTLHTRLCIIILFSVGVFSNAAAAPREEVIKGPVTARIQEVVDGDTVSAKVHVWIGAEIETSIRFAGIDAPEMKSKCGKERALAEAARKEVEKLLRNNLVELSDIRLEKYAGRVLAHVKTTDGIDIGKVMVEKGLARPYFGKKRQPWCAESG